jgi:signal transduction histidine kinase
VTNALIHAFDNASQSGEIYISISKINSVKKYNIQIIVSDNGQGMTDNVNKNVFEPFFTTQRGNGGTGLGMNIVYNLETQKLRGKIQCQSILHKGTQFIIQLPNQI